MIKLNRRNVVGLATLVAAIQFAGNVPCVAADPPPLALKGYDTVAYFTLGRAERGRPEFEYEWDEMRYRFVSAKHRDLFKADPVRYAPQFAHACAMALTRGEVVDADPESWLISDGKLYIFGAKYGPDLFRKDLPDNIAKANKNRWMIEKR